VREGIDPCSLWWCMPPVQPTDITRQRAPGTTLPIRAEFQLYI
jgi:hypothetical protein